MLVYLANKVQFTKDIDSGTLEDKIQNALGHRVSDSERRSWNNSLLYMHRVLNVESIPDETGIAIEFRIPQTSKRIDVILSGSDGTGRAHAVVVELKQWESASTTNKDGIVKTFVGGNIREVTHPSYQVWTYVSLMNSFNEAVYSRNLSLQPCAFLHNYGPDSNLYDARYQEYLDRAPVFGKQGMVDLRAFIERFIQHGDSCELIVEIIKGRIRPSKRLSDRVSSMLDGNEEFVMIDEQKVIYEAVLEAASHSDEQKRVIIVEGGPGTGKSVVAVNLLVGLLQQRQLAAYVTKNSAPREVYAARLTGTRTKSAINNLFLNSGKFVESRSNQFDTLVVDEAHRLREKSGFVGHLGENQIKEIINAARTTVFFIDEDQRIHIQDIGSKEEILRHAEDFGAEISDYVLESQFRCNGQDGYLAWIDDVLQIRQTANETLEGVDYDFKVFSNPNELFDTIVERNEVNNRSRVVAGYCWDWKGKNDPTVHDVTIPEFGFRKRWNLSEHGQGWLIMPDSINEVGCIHTCQGLELDYVGVIIGPDLIARDGTLYCDADAHPSRDSAVRGLKKLKKENPAVGAEREESIIKNTYRTLMTRGMKGCYIFCTDKETEWYFRDRLSSGE